MMMLVVVLVVVEVVVIIIVISNMIIMLLVLRPVLYYPVLYFAWTLDRGAVEKIAQAASYRALEFGWMCTLASLGKLCSKRGPCVWPGLHQ
jgi:hypothetical protein